MAWWASSSTASECDAGGEGAAVVGVAFEQVLVDAVEGLPGDLRAAGVIEEDGWAVEGRELAANGGTGRGSLVSP